MEEWKEIVLLTFAEQEKEKWKEIVKAFQEAKLSSCHSLSLQLDMTYAIGTTSCAGMVQ